MVKIRAGKLREKDLPKISYLVEGIIPKNGLVYCFGSAGSFKTNFLMYTAMCSALGENSLDFKTEKFRTLWLDEENREIGMRDKVDKIANGLEIDNKILDDHIEILISDGFNILKSDSLIRLEEAIKEFKPQLVVIDSIAKVFPLSERDEKDVRRIYGVLRPMIEKHNVTFVLIHHARKKNIMQNGRDMEDISGSREFASMADSIILLESMKAGVFMLKQVKNRYNSKTYAVNFEVSGDDEAIYVNFTGMVKDKYLDRMNKCKEELVKWAESKGIKEFKRKEALDAMLEVGHKQSNIDAALKSLKENEVDGVYGIYKINDENNEKEGSF